MKFATVVFDFDSTLVDVETLELVSEVALKGRSDAETVIQEVKHITEMGLRGEMDFDKSLRTRMALFAPLRSHIEQVAASLVSRITPSVLQNKDFIIKNSKDFYIVSGGFDDLIFPVSDVLGFDRLHVYANTFTYDGSGRVVGVDSSRPLSQQLGKVTAIKNAALLRPLAMVGDGFTDYEVKLHGAADAFVAYVEHTHRDAVVQNADHIAHSFFEVREYIES